LALLILITLTFIDFKSRRPGTQYGLDLLFLTINTRLPSIVAIPRYKVDKGVIVVELCNIAVTSRRKPRIEHKGSLEAPIESELKIIMQNVSPLEDTA